MGGEAPVTIGGVPRVWNMIFLLSCDNTGFLSIGWLERVEASLKPTSGLKVGLDAVAGEC